MLLHARKLFSDTSFKSCPNNWTAVWDFISIPCQFAINQSNVASSLYDACL